MKGEWLWVLGGLLWICVCVGVGVRDCKIDVCLFERKEKLFWYFREIVGWV